MWGIFYLVLVLSSSSYLCKSLSLWYIWNWLFPIRMSPCRLFALITYIWSIWVEFPANFDILYQICPFKLFPISFFLVSWQLPLYSRLPINLSLFILSSPHFFLSSYTLSLIYLLLINFIWVCHPNVVSCNKMKWKENNLNKSDTMWTVYTMNQK